MYRHSEICTQAMHPGNKIHKKPNTRCSRVSRSFDSTCRTVGATKTLETTCHAFLPSSTFARAQFEHYAQIIQPTIQVVVSALCLLAAADPAQQHCTSDLWVTEDLQVCQHGVPQEHAATYKAEAANSAAMTDQGNKAYNSYNNCCTTFMALQLLWLLYAVVCDL